MWRNDWIRKPPVRGVVDLLLVDGVDEVRHQLHDVPWSEVLAEVVPHGDRVLEEVLERVALHVRVRVQQGERRQLVDDLLEGLRVRDEELLLEDVPAVVVLAHEPRKDRVVHVVEHLTSVLLAERLPTVLPLQDARLPDPFPLVLDLAYELEKEQVGELSEALDAFAEPLFAKEAVGFPEHGDQLLAGVADRLRRVEIPALLDEPE